MALVSEFINEMKISGLQNVSVIIGGIIPEDDMVKLKKLGIAKVYTPKDYDLNRIMLDIVKLANDLR